MISGSAPRIGGLSAVACRLREVGGLGGVASSSGALVVLDGLGKHSAAYIAERMAALVNCGWWVGAP